MKIKFMIILLAFMLIGTVNTLGGEICYVKDNKSDSIDNLIKEVEKYYPKAIFKWEELKDRRCDLKEEMQGVKVEKWNVETEHREMKKENYEYEKEELNKSYKGGSITILEYKDKLSEINQRYNSERYNKNVQWVNKNESNKLQLKECKKQIDRTIDKLANSLEKGDKKLVKKHFNEFLRIYKKSNTILENNIREIK